MIMTMIEYKTLMNEVDLIIATVYNEISNFGTGSKNWEGLYK